MFSGIVEEKGQVVSFDGERLEVRASDVLPSLEVSGSVAVSGVCLTVIENVEGGFVVEVMPETRERTNFDRLDAGDDVNLERPLRYGGDVGGHFVQGHVDGVATVESITPDGNSIRIWLNTDESIIKYVVEKGFIALDGISLTITEVSDTAFSVAIIPYTKEHTTLGSRNPGDSVNVEVDITAKYIERFATPYLERTSK